jgi:hypothetical protein
MILVVALLLVVPPRPIEAGLLFLTADSSVSVGGGGFDNQSHLKTATGTSLTTTLSSSQFKKFGATASSFHQASLTGTVSVGRPLGAHLGLTADSSAISIGVGAGADANVALSWGDSGVATGTPEKDGMIHLPWSFDVKDMLSVTQSHATNSDAYVHARLQTSTRIDINIFDFAKTPNRGPTHFTGELLLRPGESFFVTAFFAGDALSNVVDGKASASVIADSSAEFHLNSDPSGLGSYRMDSGISYASPAGVPEPAGIVMFSLGIVTLGMCLKLVRSPSESRNK